MNRLALHLAAALAAGSAWAIDSTDDIRDIRGPKSIPGAWLLPAIAVACIILATSAYGIWRWRRRAVRGRELSAQELALRGLDAARNLLTPSQAREFGIAASEVVRTYIERRFAVVATQKTTEEFLAGLLSGTQEGLSRYRSLLGEFLQQCDYVKFGGAALTSGASLTSKDMESLLQSARSFVLETGSSAAA